MKFVYTILLSLSLILSACSPGATAPGSAATAVVSATAALDTPVSTTAPGAAQTPALEAAAAGGLSPALLKYRVLDAYPDFFFCDPDSRLAQADLQALASQRLPQIQADADAYTAILARLGLQAQAQFSDAQLIAIFQDYKKLDSMLFTRVKGVYRFHILLGPAGQPGQEGKGFAVSGTVDGAGKVTETQRTPSIAACQ